MSDKKSSALPISDKAKEVYMQADIVDQINTNQQSNMSLCTCSVITQSHSTVKLNSGGALEVDE